MRQFTVIKRDNKYYYDFINNRGESIQREDGDLKEVPEQLLSCIGQIDAFVETHGTPQNVLLEVLTTSATDEQKKKLIQYYPNYQTGVNYKVGEEVKYEGLLFRVLVDHTSQMHYTPTKTPTLYLEIAPEGVIPDWRQPIGAHDAYNKDFIVKYNEKYYKSTIDGNVWTPVSYPNGWQEVNAEGNEIIPTQPDPEEPGTIPNYVQPTGAHDSYSIGDRVIYEGSVYESTIDGNIWTPTSYPQGWQFIEEVV